MGELTLTLSPTSYGCYQQYYVSRAKRMGPQPHLNKSEYDGAQNLLQASTDKPTETQQQSAGSSDDGGHFRFL
jgi:hypothetical protein